MHILTTTSASLDDLAEPVDLRQTPADIVALSFTDSDLAGMAAAWNADAKKLPSMRLAALRDLRHPMSVDLWIDSVAAHAKVILVRILGGYDWWRYGCDQLAAIARAKGIKLALLPGECRDEDLRLIECSTLPRAELDALLDYFREGGPANMRALVQRLAGLARGDHATAETPVEVPKAGFYDPEHGVVGVLRLGVPGNGEIKRTHRPHPLLPFHAACRRCRADRRALCGASRQGHRPGSDLRRQPEGPGFPGLRRSRSRRPEPCRHRHRHRLCYRRGTGLADPVRPRRRPGVPGDRRDDPARSLGKEPARPRAGRPRHACRHARTRRPHPRRRDLLQGRGRNRRRRWPSAPSPTGRNPTASSRWPNGSPP